MLTHHQYHNNANEIALAYKLKEFSIVVRSVLGQPLEWFSNQIGRCAILIIGIVIISILLIVAIPLSLVLAAILYYQSIKIKQGINDIPNLSIGELQKVNSILEDSAKEITEKLKRMESKDIKKIPLMFRIILSPLKLIFTPFRLSLGHTLRTSWEFKKKVKQQLAADFAEINEALETNTPIAL